MNHRVLVVSALFLLAVPAVAEQPHALTPTALEELKQACPLDAPLRAAQHALAKVDGDSISQNWELIIDVDPHFSLRLKKQGITDQKNSGRCWMFSALNVIRPGVAGRLKVADIELSQCYVMFFEKLEKANLFLDAVIATKDRPYTDRFVESVLRQTTQDGQNWLGFVQLVEKYGVVPKSVMPETYSSSNTGHVNHVLSLRLKRAAVEIRRESAPEQVEAVRRQALQDVYRILVMNLGAPPEEFEWRYEDRDKKVTDPKRYTPRRFFDEFVGETLDDYCALYSIPTLDFGRKYEIDLDKTVSDQPNLSFVNVPLESLKDFTRASLLDSNVVWFGCDVGQQSNLHSGLMIPRLYDYESLYGMGFELSRQELFETYSSTPTHNMVFTGLDIVDGKVRKWLVENSWGTTRGAEGYFTMLDGWFDDYVQEVVVRKKYVSPAVLDIFKTAATVLPPWDPMLMGR